MFICQEIPPSPSPYENERPTAYADRLRFCVRPASAAHKKRFGQYLTSVEVADFMAKMCQPARRAVRVLDPGAGVGILSCALCEALATGPIKPVEIQLEAYETDDRFLAHLVASLAYTREWLRAQGIILKYKVFADDFVMTHANILSDIPQLFPVQKAEKNGFDLIICNPPYFKIPKSDPRAQAAAAVVHGQPNIYALFMAVSASLLNTNGQLIFIIPRSFASGQYFRLFRDRFFGMVQPQAIHLFGSRCEAFSRDEILQENIILLAKRADNWSAQTSDELVEISCSEGVRDLTKSRKRQIPLSDILDFRSKDKILRIPTADEEAAIARMVRSWEGSLHAYGMNISTGPVVPFRAVPLLFKSGNATETPAPLLWMQNVSSMRVQWPAKARGKEQYIVINDDSRPLLVANNNYVLLRRFSAKEARRRLVAAPFLAKQLDSPFIGLENHLNYVYRPHGSLSEEEAFGLAALLNSALLDTYFRTFNGNTQVSATEVRAMPLPPLSAITEIGRRVMASAKDIDEIDAITADVLHSRS